MSLATKIISGISDGETMTKLLAIKSEEFNLDKVVDICRTEETARKNERNLSGKSVTRVVGRKNIWDNQLGGMVV